MEKTTQPPTAQANVNSKRFSARVLAALWVLVFTGALLFVAAFWGMDMPLAGPPPLLAMVWIWCFAMASTVIAVRWEWVGGILIIIAGVLPVALLPLAVLIDSGAAVAFGCLPALVLVPGLAILAGRQFITSPRQPEGLRLPSSRPWVRNLIAGAPVVGIALLGLLASRAIRVEEAKNQAHATAIEAARNATLTAEATAQAPLASLMSAHYSPDGKRIVTASLNGTARVWDAESGQQLLVLPHQGAVNVAQFSPDGQRLVSADQSPAVYVWDAGTGNRLLVLKGSGVGYDAAFSPDSKQIVTRYEYDKTDSVRYGVSVWDAATGKMVVAFEADGAGGLKHVKFSPDGQKVMTSYYTDPVGVWDAATGKRLLSLGRPHSGAAAFSPDGMQIVAGGWETARIFDATTGKELLVVNGEHAGTVSDLSYSHDGEQIVSISETNVYVWDAKTGEQLATWNGGSEVLSAEFSPDGKRILTAHGEGGARVWDAATGRQLLVLHVAPAGK